MSYARIILQSYGQPWHSAGAVKSQAMGKEPKSAIGVSVNNHETLPIVAPLKINYDDKNLAVIARDAKLVPLKDIRPSVAVGVPVPHRNRPRTLVELLATCPTEDDIRQIRDDFNIYFDVRLLAGTGNWNCSQNGTESSLMLTMYNSFRIMRDMEFDSPIPLLGTTNVYAWLLRVRPLGIHYLYSTSPTVGGYAGDGIINLNGTQLSQPWTRVAHDPSSGISAIVPIGLIVHEGRHLQGYDHYGCALNGGNSDISLEYGGAFAAVYWWEKWCAEHSDDFLPPSVREMMQYRANARINGEYASICPGDRGRRP